MMPDPVHHHPRRERIGGAEHPLGELPAARRVGRPRAVVGSVDGLEEPSRHGAAGPGRRPLDEDPLVYAVAIEQRGCRRRHEPRVADRSGPRGGEPLELSDRVTGRVGMPIDLGRRQPRGQPRRPRRIPPAGLVDRRHHRRHAGLALEGRILDVHEVSRQPIGDVTPEILADPAPRALRVHGGEVRTVERRALEEHVPIDRRVYLEPAPNTVPEHALGDRHLRRAEDAARAIDVAERLRVAFARRRRRRPDGIAAGMPDGLDREPRGPPVGGGQQRGLPCRHEPPCRPVAPQRRAAGREVRDHGALGRRRRPPSIRRCHGRQQRPDRRPGLLVDRDEPLGHAAVRRQRLERHLPIPGRHHRTGDRVVVGGGDGVELVVVASRASQREPEKRLAERVHAVVDPVGLVLADVDRRVDLLAEQPEAGTDDRLVAAGGVEPRRLGEVAGDLLADKPVVGQVGVEGPHHPVAILPRVGDRVVELVPAGLRVADDVEPMPGEPLAVVWRREQTVDVPLERRRVRVGSHSRDGGRIGRQAGEHLADAADELVHRRLAHGRELCRLEPRQHEAVDVGATPGRVRHRRRDRGLRRGPAPMRRPAGRQIERRSGGPPAVVRPRQTAPHPLLERGHRGRGQAAVRGHLEFPVVPHGLHEQARIWIPGHGDSFRGEKVGSGVEGQAALGIALGRRMACGAVFDEQGPHPRLEKLGIRGRRGIGRRTGRAAGEHHQAGHRGGPNHDAEHATAPDVSRCPAVIPARIAHGMAAS